MRVIETRHPVGSSLTSPLVQAAMLALAVALMAGCVVEDPVIEATTGSASAVVQPTPAPTASPPQFQTPTEAPVSPTAPPLPTATSAPTAAPTPLATPLPALDPEPELVPSLVPAGPVSVPVAGLTQFRLSAPRPILQLPEHTLIYLDQDRLAEVDVFAPVASGDATPLPTYGDVVDRLVVDPIFAAVEELDPVSIAGFPARVFEGTPVTGERGFYNDLSTVPNESAGWFPPVRVRMWVIDAPLGTVIVSAETLEDPGQYSDAVRLATEILTTITFAS